MADWKGVAGSVFFYNFRVFPCFFQVQVIEIVEEHPTFPFHGRQVFFFALGVRLGHLFHEAVDGLLLSLGSVWAAVASVIQA